jgi:AcrR family transcriptional regulator
MKRTRLKPDDRREQIVDAVLELAKGKNYSKVTRDEIAAALSISGPAIQHHFGTMVQLRRSVVRAACQRAVTMDPVGLRVVAQGLADGSIKPDKVSDLVRAAVRATL